MSRNLRKLYAQKQYQVTKIENLSWRLQEAKSSDKQEELKDKIRRAKRKYAILQKKIDEVG